MNDMEQPQTEAEIAERREWAAHLSHIALHHLRAYGEIAVTPLIRFLETKASTPTAFGNLFMLIKNKRVRQVYVSGSELHLQAIGPISDNDGPALPDLAIASEDRSSGPPSS